MRCTAKVCSAYLLALILSFAFTLQAQTGSPVFRSPADAGRTTRYRSNLIRYNEAWAIRVLRTLHSSEATYQATVGNGNYGTLAELREQNLIDQVLARGQRSGYLFRVRVETSSSESPSAFEIVAVPRSYGRTGRRSFYVNETGVIFAADKKGVEANAADDPLDP